MNRQARRLKRRQEKQATSRVAADGRHGASQPTSRESWPSQELQEADYHRAGVALLNKADKWAGVRNALRQISKERDEWAGYPMPLEGKRLIVEPKYPRAKELTTIFDKPEKEAERAGFKVRNTFYSHKLRCDIVLVEKDGRVTYGIIPAVHHFKHDLDTLFCSVAWGIEQEHNAVQLLGRMVTHHQFKSYLLTGMLMETSRRSKLTYLFRRLKPTVVIDARNGGDTESRIVCCLCAHPIAYYEGSWGGAMCPTDDVVAHLSMMRGDEHMYWRRCNQHAAYRPEAGL